MKIAEIKGKMCAIKCTTKEEMKAVVNFLHNEVPWAYVNNFRIEAFDNHYIFIFINQDGAYTNYKGEQLTSVAIKLLAKDFLLANNTNSKPITLTEGDLKTNIKPLNIIDKNSILPPPPAIPKDRVLTEGKEPPKP